jgi:DNA-binding response OmpR family regulator
MVWHWMDGGIMDEIDRATYEQAGGRATPDQMTRQHIFVVNGAPEFLDIVRQLLQDEHYNVTTTNFVPHTFETIAAAQPALLIVDLVLGEQAGWDLLAQLRAGASTCEIPVLLVSTTPNLLKKAQEHHDEFGGDQYLVKPFDLDDLLNLIGEMIGQA